MITEICEVDYSVIMFTIAAIYLFLILCTLLLLFTGLYCGKPKKSVKLFKRDYEIQKVENDENVQYLMTRYYFSDETFQRNSFFLTNEDSHDLIKDNLSINYNIDTASTKL
jgi:hypothetical protein